VPDDPRPSAPKARAPVPTGITGPGVLAIARHLDPVKVPATCEALLRGGIRAFELTLNAPESTALKALTAAVRWSEGSGIVVGAGTVLSMESARRAIDAGAAFLVAPHLDTEVVVWAARDGIPMLPGAATPTEVLAAWRAGATAVKVFPASTLGPSFVRELRGPLPDVPLLPTGGVTVGNAAAYIEAGAVAVGIASWLFGGGSPSSIIERAREAVGVVAAARASRQALRS
jgi:2-dehydro-3-deoxyphosphogluconate aldolase / (4S)-4-hydroxy-2-oxoglutarate aldolase